MRDLEALWVRSSTQEVCCWYLGARPSRGARTRARARARARARGPPRPVGVRQHEQSRKNFPIYTGPCKIYVGHQPRTTVDFPYKIKDFQAPAVGRIRVQDVKLSKRRPCTLFRE